MFWIYIGIIFIVSFVWAILSMRKELEKPWEVRQAKKELKRAKILFKR